MNLPEIFDFIQNKLEAKQGGKRFTDSEMANKIGCCEDTYNRYRKGRSKPTGVDIMFKILKKLDNKDIIKIVRDYKEG